MRRKHQRRYQGCFARLAHSVTAGSRLMAAGLLVVLGALTAIVPASAQAQSVTYRVTFEGKFTASALASGVSVPSGEHFTTLIGAVHNDSVTFWSSGGTASAGIEAVAELGTTDTFKSEITAAMLNALAVIEQSIASGGTATATVDITLTTDHPLVTLLSMIAPSPDWFVGVSGLSLRNTSDDGWQPSLSVDLFPYDAGTEEGTEFSLNNAATSPQGTIANIKGTGKFSDQPIATLTFDHQSINTAPELILAASPAEIVEAGGSAMVTVEITNGVTFAEDQEIALSFAGTATKGTDYTVALESLTLTAGQSSVATTVTAVQDSVDDDAETILITASHGGGTIGAEQTITIIDDDATTCSEGMAGTYPCSNVDLMSFLALADIGGGSANDIWGWTDSSTGKEYAIMGRTNGTSFVDISDPVNPIYLGNLPPPAGEADERDIKVYADHAFIVTEANNSGMQVFDLTQLRMVASPPATFSETAHYPHFSDAHNLAINEDSGFAYAAGTNNCSGGLHMINIQTPTNPTSAGCFSGDGYTHDAQCVNYDGPDLDHQGKEICFNSNLDTLTIVDVTNKAAPVMLSRTGYSGSRYTHQGWLTEDQVYFLLGDELDEKNNPSVTNTRTYMWNVSDLDDPALIGSHDSTTTAIDHNQYVKGSYTYQSNYQAGLRILDITDIANGNLSEAAFFDVYPGGDSTSFNGSWSNFPFFDSGIVIVSVIEQGLFILRPNPVDVVNPALSSATVNGAALTLTYGEALDEGSRPAPGDFTVQVDGSGRSVSGVSVSGRVVTLTLASAVAHGEAVTVSYSPGTNPIQDAVGNDALGLSNDPVRNDTPDTTAPTVSSLTISSNPGSDQTYAAGDEIEVTVTFNETVEVEGTPQLRLRVGSRNRTAGYDSGTGTAALVFGYEVADGDEDTGGVSIEAGRIALNRGTIEDEAENAAELAHEALATQAGHKVDGVRPSFLSAAVDGASLALTYGEALDGGSRPATGDFTVEVEGSGRSVTGVSISGSVVTLTLNPAVEHGDTGIRVSYTVPTGVGANPIQDAVGNDARGLNNQSVTNTTGAPNTGPEITTQGPLSVGENQALVRRLAARDTDAGDEVTGWEIVGGADRFQFSVSPDTGELSFQTPPDYEDPTDEASTDPPSGAGDNEYVVTVEVRSGAGVRELEAEQMFTIRVTDEREPPEVPEAPTFSGETADSLEVNWSEPDNTGPPITDYDVQYREKGTGRFIDGDQQGPGRTLTLEDLEPGTVYEVQVRAKNDEGTSDWSDPGEGMTVTPLTVVMTSGTEPPLSGPFTVRFSFSEPVTGFSASDIETGQDPACVDDQNNTVFCDPGIGGLQTTDNRVFTTTVTPWTNRVAHSYTLRLTVPGGAVRSSVGSKPNEEPEEPLEVRVAPPGVTEPISSIGLGASPGSGSMRLSWNRPSDNGGSAIIRYEVRYQAVGEAWSEWEKVGAGSRGVTVGGLINGREYIFEVRAVNALGKGGAETARAVPERRIAPPPPPPPRGGGGGGGGGGLLFPPEAPLGLMAMPGEGAVRLEWSPPESDGGTPILRYEYRLKEGRGEFGEWTPIEDSAPDEVNATGYTVGELGNGTVYVFELRGVNLVGNGRVSEAVEAVMGLDRAYWSNFGAEDLQGIEASLERGPFGGGPQSLRLRFGADLRFEESELDGEGEVTETRSGSYGYRYTSRTTGELSLDYEGGEACELRLTFREVGAGSYRYRCGGVLGGQGSFRLSGLNQAPEITGAGAYEVAENTARVGRIEAVDGDDEIGGYGIAGGADGGLFAVEAETGELMFREAPDYEDPGDVASEDPQSGAGDNEYIVVVEVRSGEGERERRRSRAIRVRVSDEEEPPGAPAAPVVTAEGSDSLKVSWREPENRGPEIVDYEVRYREAGEAGYRDGGHEGTGLEVRLSGLEEGTIYQVQVRAVNEEGMSEWSEPGEGRTDTEEADADDPSDFTEGDLEGRRLTLRLEGDEETARSLELRFGEGNRFEQIESGGQEAATRSEGASRSGSYAYQWTGPRMGTVRLAYDDGASCEIRLSFTESGVGAFAYDCGGGDPAEGSFRLTTGSLFVPVILSSAGQNQSFFTSELTLTNRGEQDVRLDYTYTADRGGGTGTASDVLPAGRQRVETDALTYLRGLGVSIPETGNRIGTLRVEARLGSEVEAVVRTTTLVPEGRAGLAYPGVAEEKGFDEPVYLCGLRQNGQDRSNVAFQNMGAPEEGAITVRTTVYSGEAADATARVLEDIELEPGEFHQYSGLLGVLGVPAQGYVRVERVEGRAPFYAYGVINDQANSDGSFIFPVTASSLEGVVGQTLPVIVETSEFRSELTVTNFSGEARRLDFQFVAEGIEGDDKTAGFSMRLEAGRQEIVADVVDELRRQEVAGLGSGNQALAGAVFATAVEGDMSGIVIGARTGSEGGGGSYSVFYNAVPYGEAFIREAWVDGLQQNEENRSNLALVNTGEVDGSASVFHLEIYDGETGLLGETVVTKPIQARSWHQINGILGSYGPETQQGYIRILKVSGQNPFLAYGVVNDGGAPGERSGDGAYLPARE